MSHDDDILLPNVWEGADEPADVSVQELFTECRKIWEEQSIGYLAQAEMNERYLVGDQHLTVDSNFNVTSEYWPSEIPKTSRNLLRNLSLTWSSRLLEDRPWVRCYAAVPGLDQAKAQVGNRLLEYNRQQHDFDQLCFDAAQLVQPHSCIGFKIVWDPLRGPLSEGVPAVQNGVPLHDANGEPMMIGAGDTQGDVSWEAVSIFDYGTDGAEKIEDSRWVIFKKMIDLYDARHLLEASGHDPSESSAGTYRDVWGVQRKGVEVLELWHKPDYRFPKGLFAVLVGDKVVQAIPYPYVHGELPLAVWKCGSRRGSAYGSTHVDDAVWIQKSINTTVAALEVQSRLIGSIKLLAHSSIIAEMQNGNQQIKVDDPEAIKAAKFLEPPPRSEVLVQSLEDNVQALYAVYGLNEILSGAENAKSGTSAKSIAYLAKLDGQKMGGAARSLQKAIVRLARQTLKLYQQYVQAPRLIQITGEGDFAVQEFIGADLDGIDVMLEDSSAIPQMRGQVAGDAQQQIQAGNPDPALREVAQTGIQDTAYGKAARDIVRQQIEGALGGEPGEPDPEVNPQIAVEEISKAMSSVPQQQAGMLRALLQAYQGKMAANTQVAAQPPPEGAPK